MRYILSLIACVGLIYASDFEIPALNQEFIKKAFLQTSRADLGGVLQCQNMSGNKVKNLKTSNTIKYNAKAESKALSLIIDSLTKSRTRHIREAEESPTSKNL